jgi:hypothetical protein
VFPKTWLALIETRSLPYRIVIKKHLPIVSFSQWVNKPNFEEFNGTFDDNIIHVDRVKLVLIYPIKRNQV